MTLRREQLHDYQASAVEHIKAHPQSMLWLDLGLGKTVSTLTAIVDMMSTMQVYGVLILAPLRVVQTVWASEAKKWEHTKGLTFSLIHGKPERREWALRRPANVYLLNYEGSQWAVDQFINHYLAKGKPLPFNMIVYDEITRLKSSRDRQGGSWGAALKKIIPYVPWRVGLTATPAPNGLQDLFGQYLMIDDGVRLGRVYHNFEASYFTTDRNGFNIKPTPDAWDFVKAAVSDITIEMNVDDYLELPPVSVNDISVTLTPRLRKQYDKLEKEMLLQLDSGSVVDVDSAAVLSGKVRQFVNGAMYTDQEDRTKWELIHDLKLEALREIIESLGGKPLLLGYQFQCDAVRIKNLLDKMGVRYAHFNASVKGDAVEELMNAWNSGDLPVLMGQGQAISHGLNLQYSCSNVAWFGCPWSMEVYNQFNGRVAKRQGQKNPVMIHRIMVEKTIDNLVSLALSRKSQDENDLREAVREYRNQ